MGVSSLELVGGRWRHGCLASGELFGRAAGNKAFIIEKWEECTFSCFITPILKSLLILAI